MRPIMLATLALLAASAMGGPLDAQVQLPSGPRLLLIAIDGLRPDYVLDAERLGIDVPNLRKFVTEGAYATSVVGVLPTVTYPSFTTVLTGVSPSRHGIVANTSFDPLLENAGGWYWYTEDVRVPTLWHVANDAGLSTGNVHWPVSVGAPIRWNLPQIWRTGTPDDRRLLRALATPGLQNDLESRVGAPYADGIDETIEGDENRGRFAVAMLEAHRPEFMTAYFTALDHEQHLTGPYTAEDYAVLQRIDAIVGDLVETARRLSGGQVTVAIASDHGFEATRYEVSLLTAFRDAGLIEFSGEGDGSPTSWEAAPWGAGATFAIMLNDPSNQAARDAVGSLLRRLAVDPANGIDRILEPRELAAYRAFPDAAFAVVLKAGYQVGQRTSGPLVVARTPGGMHGYPPDSPNMKASFFVAGPGVARGRSLGEIDMRDVAPTLASLLGLRLGDADGRVLDVR